MIISDLNYLEVVAQATEVVGGDGYGGRQSFDVYVDVDKDIYIDEDVDIYKDLYVKSYVSGFSAIAQADASAKGYYGTAAQGFSFTFTDRGFSSASALSISQSN
jgi:hypothetical protein